jgi:hypothetical protein
MIVKLTFLHSILMKNRSRNLKHQFKNCLRRKLLIFTGHGGDIPV